MRRFGGIDPGEDHGFRKKKAASRPAFKDARHRSRTRPDHSASDIGIAGIRALQESENQEFFSTARASSSLRF